MTVDYGHTSYETAFDRADVYGVGANPERARKRPLAIGIVGCGGVAQAKWLPALRRLQTIGEPVTLAGVADPDAERRGKVGRMWSAPVFPDADALLATQPDAVLVAAADAAHVPAARAAIEAGVACLVEKPLARRLADALALCAFAESRGVLLASVANKRFSPPYHLAKELIAAGRLRAAPHLFQGKFTLGYPYVDLLESGAVHLFDLALWFMGPVAEVHAIATTRADGALESAAISFRFRSGAIGSLVTSAAALSFKPWERVEMFGSRAMLCVEDQFALTLYDEETGPAKSWRPAIPNTLIFDESFGGYAGLLEHFLDAVRGLAPLEPTGRDGAAIVELVEATRLSLARKAPVPLPLGSAG